MQVFLSWSGRRSRAIADALAKWLSQVVQAVEPWVSFDMDKGTRWAPEVAERLEKSKIGIICLTPENVDSRWILFEAGALSKTDDAYVCTFLLALTPADVEAPLGQFQHTTFEKLDVLKLVRTVNTAVARSGERALPDAILTDVFETFWPQLEAHLTAILNEQMESAPPRREQAEVLEEILTIVRGIEWRLPPALNVLSHEYYNLMRRRGRGGDVWVYNLLRHAGELGDDQVNLLLTYMTRMLAERGVSSAEATKEEELPPDAT